MIQIETTSHDPFFNQAFEDYVFRTFREDEVLLLWRNRPAVVVGCYQNICREVHVRALLEQNIPVVRRMSGGGTVYHDLGNLNYTLITGQSGALDYDRCLAPVLRALNALGVPAQRPSASRRRSSPTSAALPRSSTSPGTGPGARRRPSPMKRPRNLPEGRSASAMRRGTD